LRGDEGTWTFTVPLVRRIRDELDVLFAQPDVTADAIFEDAELPGICASGSPLGAEYYAARHHLSKEDDQPIFIEFAAPLDTVYVDPPMSIRGTFSARYSSCGTVTRQTGGLLSLQC